MPFLLLCAVLDISRGLNHEKNLIQKPIITVYFVSKQYFVTVNVLIFIYPVSVSLVCISGVAFEIIALSGFIALRA